MQGLWGIKSFMLTTELWGHSSLLLWYSKNWGSPKFGLLFVEKEQLVNIAAPAQTLLAWAEWEKPTWVQVMHRETWPGTLNGLTSALAPRQGSSAVLHFMQMGLPHSWWGNAWVSLLQNDRQNHSAWETLPWPTLCVCRARIVWPRACQPALEEAAYAVKWIF